MKYLILLLTTLIISFSALSQDKKENVSFLKVGLSYSSFGQNPIFYFKSMDGAPSYEGNSFYTMGLVLIKPLSDKLELETGIEYSEHIIKITPNLDPSFPNTPYNKTKTLWSIPIGIRYNLSKYFYLKTGLFMDFDSQNIYELPNQQGIGANIGLGAKYDFDFGISLFVAPYLKAHSLIPFKKQGSQAHLMETGFNMGLLYAF